MATFNFNVDVQIEAYSMAEALAQLADGLPLLPVKKKDRYFVSINRHGDHDMKWMFWRYSASDNRMYAATNGVDVESCHSLGEIEDRLNKPGGFREVDSEPAIY